MGVNYHPPHVPNYVRLEFGAMVAKRNDLTREDALDLWRGVQWAYTQGNYADHTACADWLRAAQHKCEKCGAWGHTDNNCKRGEK